MFSDNYIIARITYLENMLSGMPKVTLSKQADDEVVYLYRNIDGVNKRNRYRISHKKGKEYLDYYNRIQIIKSELKKLFASYGHLQDAKRVTVKPAKIMPYTIKNKLIPDSNPMPKQGDYWFKGIQMRSRLEIVTAEVIDSMGLEFMYEPGLNINGTIYYPDFIVFLPELGCCFVIECVGKAEDKSYLYNNIAKLVDYINVGFQPNMNYLLFCGTISFIPDPCNMRADIENLINNLARNLVE